MPFKNYSLTKNGQLTIGQIFSPDFIAGLSGWEIRKDGTAEFNNLVIRGTFFGLDFEINSAGAFFYGGTPAAGNLVLSAAQSSGNDEFGNAYKQGFTAYGPGTAVSMWNDNGLYAGLVFHQTGSTSLTVSPQAFAVTANTGAANEFAQAALTSGKESGNDDAALQLFSESADATIAAKAVIEFGGQAVAQFSRTGLLSAIQPGTGATAETWHSLPLANSWAASSDGLAAYKLTPENQLIIEAAIMSGTSTTICTLPAGYRPANRTMFFPVAFSGANTASIFGQVNQAGVLSLSSITSVGTVVLNAVIPLDVP